VPLIDKILKINKNTYECYKYVAMNKNKISTFAQTVYDLTSQIPSGKVTTYKLIATAMNKPKACQAVAKVLSINPYAPTVPCHRVVSSTGHISGYFGTNDSSQVDKKIDLLKSEGVHFNKHMIENMVDVLFVPCLKIEFDL
jgi:methylated-DNA-[protein]-cysteine S-methyltransferase